MTQKDSRIDDTSELETRPDPDRSGDDRGIWGGIIDDGISRIGKAPSPQQYPSAITSSIKALDKEAQVLEDAIEVIRDRHANEVRVLEGVLRALNEHLEGEEHEIARSIAAIRRHRNLLSPVMRLPPEILSRIFMFHAPMESIWTGGALTSTHVCKQWWEIGRACPGLWSYINYGHCRSAAWMAEMIKRSRAAPLSFSITREVNLKVDAQKIVVIVDNMHRFESLELGVPSGGDNTLFEVLNKPILMLRHLTILNHGSAMFAFPPEFLSGSAPSLRYMKIVTDGYIPWDSGLFVHLTSLNATTTRARANGNGNQPSLGMLLSALARMPGLETLILNCCLPPTPSTTVKAHVYLPKLKRLEVVASLARCTCFLRQITINHSATVHLYIRCSKPSVSREDIEELFSVFPSHLHTTSAPIAQALKFIWDDPHCFEVEIWTVQQNTELKTSQNASIRLVFNWESIQSRGARPLDLAWACFAAFASPQLRSFRMSGSHIAGWDSEVWRRLARVAPNVQRLVAETEAQCAELCKALSPPDMPNPVPADCCLPALSYLELEPTFNHLMPNQDGTESPLSVVFARSLATRALIGCSTPELAFSKTFQRDDCPEGWFDPFDAVPGLIMHTGQWRTEPLEMNGRTPQ